MTKLFDSIKYVKNLTPRNRLIFGLAFIMSIVSLGVVASIITEPTDNPVMSISKQNEQQPSKEAEDITNITANGTIGGEKEDSSISPKEAEENISNHQSPSEPQQPENIFPPNITVEPNETENTLETPYTPTETPSITSPDVVSQPSNPAPETPIIPVSPPVVTTPPIEPPVVATPPIIVPTSPVTSTSNSLTSPAGFTVTISNNQNYSPSCHGFDDGSSSATGMSTTWVGKNYPYDYKLWFNGDTIGVNWIAC